MGCSSIKIKQEKAKRELGAEHSPHTPAPGAAVSGLKFLFRAVVVTGREMTCGYGSLQADAAHTVPANAVCYPSSCKSLDVEGRR